MCLPKTHSFFCVIIFFHLITNTLWLQNLVEDAVYEEDKTSYLIQVSGSNYKTNTLFINESGLYSLILSSQLPQAKAFKRWVTSEVHVDAEDKLESQIATSGQRRAIILLRLRHSRCRQTPMFLKRVKVHAIRRELQLQFLKHHWNFGDFSNDKNQKWKFKSYMSLSIFFLCP